MHFAKLAGITTFMIYLGTLLLSVLSFFTTYNGMTIILNEKLAFIGSLGLQVVLLGIAWSIMRLREHRLTYLSAFGIAAVFSIFFSFVNFDTALQESTRSYEARSRYAGDLRKILARYAESAEEASMKGRYQVNRLNKLLEMEQEKGWATIVDEGSQDVYIQAIIDGARATVKSWEENQGSHYRQGKGRGVIVNYLESNIKQVSSNLQLVEKYNILLDSVTLELNSNRPVSKQFALANYAWVNFPINEVAVLTSETVPLPMPPSQLNYIEKAENRQQAFLLVIGDLLEMNHLALFSILLAIAIDLIIVIMAFAGSHIHGDIEFIFDRIKRESSRQLNKVSLDNADEFSETLQKNIEKYRQVSKYGRDVSRLIGEYKKARRGYKFSLNRGGEKVSGTTDEFIEDY